MAVEFNVIQKVNPRDLEGERKFYATAVSSGEINLKQLGERISSMSTVNRADVFASLDLLLQVMKEEITDGKIIRLGDFGSFNITLSSEGEQEEGKVTANSVKEARLNFKPGNELNGTLKTLTFKKVRSTEASVAKSSK
ncbi:DNA-binding protein [Pedobacter sp. HMF7647]|uniref:DNA-binding protein n=1 Tax=Hufsiella arboris TaxID=2695275 RepID=A0A7K1YDE7_9SPHI|nr:HU family DNA-binding protein [Hufsiella arboris]MXV52614.1 DNA-binding protein [Hufsiella arboris]